MSRSLKEIEAIELLECLNHYGLARFVGGCVRDHLLGRVFYDVDVATTLAPQDVIEMVSKKGMKAVPTGIEHGTVTVVNKGKVFEVTTLRKDEKCDGRHAQVVFTDSWHKDAARRDFTMNALYMSAEGEFFDYFDGEADLRQGIVRFVGEVDARITEDYLRILRYFRFLAHYSQTEPMNENIEACALHREGLNSLSGERVQQEMIKLLQAKNPVPALNAMKTAGVLEMVAHSDQPSLEVLSIAMELATKKGVVLPWQARLAALVGRSISDSSGYVHALSKAWKLSNKDSKAIHIFLASEFEPSMARRQQVKMLRKLDRQTVQAIMILDWAGFVALGEGDEVQSFYDESWDYIAKAKTPIFPVSGKDLLGNGMVEGRFIGDMLKKAEAHWEERDYKPSKSELLRYIAEQQSG